MSSKEMALLDAVGRPDRIGQGTAIEQSRAIAEVYAAVALAQQFPRDETYARRSMENSCRQMFVADKAFYRVPRGGQMATGETISLAKELARCWGHIHYGVFELRRDDLEHQSEMQAWAWDVQTGTRSAHGFIVPHLRDKKDKNGKAAPVELTTNQEIYENNANNGSKRLRESILSVLPKWFLERAKELCRETSEAGDGTPLADRIDRCITGFGQIGISEKQLVKKLELQRVQWTGHEVSLLGTIFTSIRNGETRKEDEFESDIITTKDIVGEPEKPAPVAEQPKAVAQPAPKPVPPKEESVFQPGDGDAENVPAEKPSQGGYEITEQTDVTVDDLPGPGAPAESGEDTAEPMPSGKGPKARRAQLTALVTLLGDNGATVIGDQLAVVSTMLDQRIPAILNGDLTAEEVTYLYTRITTLADKGEFAGLLERARKIAAGS